MKNIYLRTKQNLIYFKNSLMLDIRDRVVMAIIFATLATIVGYYAPKIFASVVGASYFYKVQEPVQIISDSYKPCDYLEIVYRRESLVAGQIYNTWKFSKLDIDPISGEIHEHTLISMSSNPTITKGIRVLPINGIQIPCGAESGDYYGTYTYTIVVNGVPLTEEVAIEPFNVE